MRLKDFFAMGNCECLKHEELLELRAEYVLVISESQKYRAEVSSLKGVIEGLKARLTGEQAKNNFLIDKLREATIKLNERGGKF